MELSDFPWLRSHISDFGNAAHHSGPKLQYSYKTLQNTLLPLAWKPILGVMFLNQLESRNSNNEQILAPCPNSFSPSQLWRYVVGAGNESG